MHGISPSNGEARAAIMLRSRTLSIPASTQKLTATPPVVLRHWKWTLDAGRKKGRDRFGAAPVTARRIRDHARGIALPRGGECEQLFTHVR